MVCCLWYMINDLDAHPVNYMSFYNLCRKELGELLQKNGFESYRSEQLFKFVYQNSLQERYIPARLLNFVKDNLERAPVGKVEKESISAVDGTRKLLIELESPKYKVETVLICEEKRNTICLSSQVGCSLSCTFCHTGTQKLLKNLSTPEILSQYFLTRHKIDNAVFMGQGEPLYNWRNVSRAVRILCDPAGIAMSRSKITISTSGISPLIPKIASELGVQLAVSLHAANDRTRSSIMPINDTYNIASILDACRHFQAHAKSYNRRISFEYVLLRDVNDGIKTDGRELVELLKDIPAHINLIPFNKWPGSVYQSSSVRHVRDFNEFLNSNGLRSTIRWSRGDDILAACGQLKSSEELKQKSASETVNLE